MKNNNSASPKVKQLIVAHALAPFSSGSSQASAAAEQQTKVSTAKFPIAMLHNLQRSVILLLLTQKAPWSKQLALHNIQDHELMHAGSLLHKYQRKRLRLLGAAAAFFLWSRPIAFQRRQLDNTLW